MELQLLCVTLMCYTHTGNRQLKTVFYIKIRRLIAMRIWSYHPSQHNPPIAITDYRTAPLRHHVADQSAL